MEGFTGRIGLLAALLFATAIFTEEVAAVKITVGGRVGWTSNVNYTLWAQNQTFYNGDWLFFVYDRNQMNVLEVNKTDYENCISDHPLQNWTTGAGRDVVPLNQTRTYYFMSGKGYCFGGMKFTANVVNPPPPPRPSPVTSSAPGNLLLSTFSSRVLVPALMTVAALWDSILVRI